jgi:flagellar basal-body rod protein FlgB
MFTNVNLLNIASALGNYATQSHTVVARNIANADTPGYQAKEVESFADAYARAVREGVPSGQMVVQEKIAPAGDVQSPNGNTVSLEEQLLEATKAKGQHELATLMYKKTMDMMKLTLGKNI